jgi:hypothetical protein
MNPAFNEDPTTREAFLLRTAGKIWFNAFLWSIKEYCDAIRHTWKNNVTGSLFSCAVSFALRSTTQPRNKSFDSLCNAQRKRIKQRWGKNRKAALTMGRHLCPMFRHITLEETAAIFRMRSGTEEAPF